MSDTMKTPMFDAARGFRVEEPPPLSQATKLARKVCPNWMNPMKNAHYRDVLAALESIEAELAEAVNGWIESQRQCDQWKLNAEVNARTAVQLAKDRDQWRGAAELLRASLPEFGVTPAERLGIAAFDKIKEGNAS